MYVTRETPSAECAAPMKRLFREAHLLHWPLLENVEELAGDVLAEPIEADIELGEPRDWFTYDKSSEEDFTQVLQPHAGITGQRRFDSVQSAVPADRACGGLVQPIPQAGCACFHSSTLHGHFLTP